MTKPFEFDDLKQRLQDAYRLAAERRAAIEVLEADAYAWTDSEVNSDFHLSDPLYFGNLNGCIGLAEFENYVIQLSTMHSGTAKIVAIKVAEVEQFYNSNSPGDFREIMNSAGASLLAATQEGRNFATYWGNGVFLLIHDVNKGKNAQMLESLLSETPADADQSNELFAYQVGEDVVLEAGTKMEALFLIDKAVELAETNISPMAKFG